MQVLPLVKNDKPSSLRSEQDTFPPGGDKVSRTVSRLPVPTALETQSRSVCSERDRGGRNRSPDLCLRGGLATPVHQQPSASGLDLCSRNGEATALSCFPFPQITPTALPCASSLNPAENKAHFLSHPTPQPPAQDSWRSLHNIPLRQRAEQYFDTLTLPTDPKAGP